MSRALSWDQAASRLWWLTDDGRLRSDRGGDDAVAVDGPWRGIAARCGRLLLWTDDGLYLADSASGGLRHLLTVDRRGFERAGWAPGEPEVVEVYWHETTGHPTDRLGFREALDVATGSRATLGFRQGAAPPWGSRGAAKPRSDLCSGPAGVAYEAGYGRDRRLWWSAAGRGGRRRLPDELLGLGHYRLLDHAGKTWVCGFLGRRVVLADVLRERPPGRFEAPDDVYDVELHDGVLTLAMRGRAPEPAP